MAAAPAPQKRTVSQIKSSLLQPALTSHYELYLPLPRGDSGDLGSYMRKLNNVFITQDNLQLACCEATLPGSSLATIEINNDYTGVTERHAYRRIYDDRIDLTFYVDSNYQIIRFFEVWIKYIVNESISPSPGGKAGLVSPNFSYTVRYPEEYQTEFSITKFERDYKSKISYTFLKAYPISISSMPISYESSSLLKCTVSFTYSRYYIQNLPGVPLSDSDNQQSTLKNPLTPSQQASVNGVNFGTTLSLDRLVDSYQFSGGVNGVPLTAANASGNAVPVQGFDTSGMTRNLGTINGGIGVPSNQA